MRFFGLVAVLLALSACTGSRPSPVVPEALEIGTLYPVLVGTTRSREADGSYGYRRSRDLTTLEMTVSVPPAHEPGQPRYGYSRPDPQNRFTLAARAEFTSDREFQNRLRQILRAQPAGRRDVTVFVHGYNATQTESAFRAAQLTHDIGLPGAQVVYSWPSQGRASGYAYDQDSMLFARDGLEKLLRLIRTTGPDNIVLVAHSMGGILAMEAMRQADIGEPGWAARTLDGVVLVAPDLDPEVFRSQVSRMQRLPQPFVVAVSTRDILLDLSGLLRADLNRERLGNIQSADKVSDLPITLVDTTAFSTLLGSHFVAGNSPALLAIFRESRRVMDTFGTDRFLADSGFPVTIHRRGGATEIRLTPPG